MQIIWSMLFVAGNYSGRGIVSKINPDSIGIVGTIDQGHFSSIRCMKYFYNFLTSPGCVGDQVHALITGGKDARVCLRTNKYGPYQPSK